LDTITQFSNVTEFITSFPSTLGNLVGLPLTKIAKNTAKNISGDFAAVSMGLTANRWGAQGKEHAPLPPLR
jgi:hypothetical protein